MSSPTLIRSSITGAGTAGAYFLLSPLVNKQKNMWIDLAIIAGSAMAMDKYVSDYLNNMVASSTSGTSPSSPLAVPAADAPAKRNSRVAFI